MNLQKKYRIGLAPMEGVSDFPYRLWVHLISNPEFSNTPFYRVTEGSRPDNIPEKWFPEFFDARIVANYRVVPQLMGSSTDDINRVSEVLVKKVPFVDVNFGCPSKRVVGRGSGSSLLKDLPYFFKFLDELAASKIPYSIKIRTGFNDDLNFLPMIEGIAKHKFTQLTVHGRTRMQSYTGLANWDLIQLAAKHVPFSVLGSGDVTDIDTLQNKLKIAPDVDGVIIARAVTRNPWIFQEIREGEAVKIDPELIVYTLFLFATLNNLFIDDYEKLVDLTQQSFMHQTLGNDLERWQIFMEELSKYIFSNSYSVDLIETSPRGLGRLKLIWHNLRTSLPELYFDPLLMRSKSGKELLKKISEKTVNYKTEMGLETTIELKPHCKYHWLFSGEGNPEKECHD